MLNTQIEQIFTKQNLENSFLEISSNSTGLDEVSYKEFKKDLSKKINELIDRIIRGLYTPEPLKKIEIEKLGSAEKRPIALGSIKDKIIQRVLFHTLNSYFDKKFSNKSYAYRSGKSTMKAINRVGQFINDGNHWILKTDIDDFFESINHDKLLEILDKQISDKRIIRLISLFLQNGTFKQFDYNDHIDGVHQGDIISPLLSNIYLDMMDRWLEKHEIPFVRYADDFVILTKKEKDINTIKPKLQEYLASLDLKLEESKTYLAHINAGFSFLGVHFYGKNKTIENERFQKAISKLHKLSKNKSGFSKYIKELNSFLQAIKNYYFKIMTKNSNQYLQLQEHLIDTISHKLYLAKKNKSVTTKKEFKILLSQIRLDLLFELELIDDKIELIIAKGYEKYLANKSYKDSKSKIDKKKNIYAKKFANDSTLHISTPGLMLGISKNKFTIKKYGKVQNTYPIDRITRIILEGKGYSLSSDVIKKCAQNSITIDFIDRDALSYASLITYKSAISQMIHKQSLILNTPLQLILAKEFIRAKAKNQINYIKYLDKYHKILDENILKMEKLLKESKTEAGTITELMGYEGSISTLYWQSLRLVLDVPFEKRITFGAKDIVNSSLNYGYAILYGKVQHSLVHAGLSLNISFLHALDDKKPTLTFDMIEEFRTFIVDRTIISMLNKDEPIMLGNDGLLTKKSRQLISKNIKEKLGSYTMWKKTSVKIENIIQTQCYNLAKTVDDNSVKYKGFIGKY
jgi:group II intron reverse transcriptase/maturase/CRISPR-associated endonuclease Cas1